MALAIVAPWVAGIAAGETAHGMVASFGAYLLGVSFPRLPPFGRVPLLLSSAIAISLFATLGASVSLGSGLFFTGAVIAALAQCLGELKGGYLRLPIALGALAYFLSVGQVPAEGIPGYGLSFLAGTLWAGVFVSLAIPLAVAPPESGRLALAADRGQRRFAAGMVGVALAGSGIACFLPGSHPCWLPAAGLRVMKPTRQQTLYRMKARGLGTTLGAASGGLILGLSPVPWIHAGLVGILVFIMLMIGARKYAPWSFCLTAIALAFNLHADGSVVAITANRVLLTIGGIALAALVLPVLQGSARPATTPTKS
jgi:fusaric acid resistance family protein